MIVAPNAWSKMNKTIRKDK